MARTKNAARIDTLHELLTRFERMGAGTVQVSLHDVPVATALEWVELGLLDGIEEGAGSNPPTGTMEAGEYPGPRASVHVFTDDRSGLTIEQREAALDRVAEELATNTALLDELKKSTEQDEEVQS